MINTAFWASDVYKANILYVFPAFEQLCDFSHTRVDKAIEDTPYLADYTTGIDNVKLKQFKEQYIYFRGSQKRRQIISVDADVLLLDEFDEFEPKNIPVCEKRIGDSTLGIKRFISTPSIPDYGIDKWYRLSSQHEWHIRCPHCNEWQIPDFFTNVDMDAAQFICAKCHQPVDRFNAEGHYEPLNPKSDIRGYAVNRMAHKRTDLKELIIASQDMLNVQEFYNSDLGVPYVLKGSRIDRETINSLISPDYEMMQSSDLDKVDGAGNKVVDAQGQQIKEKMPCAMGVDIGKVLHVVIAETNPVTKIKRYLHIAEYKEWADIYELFYRFNIFGCVIDSMPELHPAKDVYDKYPERVLLANYPNKKFNTSDYYNPSPSEPYLVNVNRTLSLDYLFNLWRRGMVMLPRDIETVPDFYEMMASLIKVKKRDEATGAEYYAYAETGSKGDHYAHACNYELLASSIFNRGIVGMDYGFI